MSVGTRGSAVDIKYINSPWLGSHFVKNPVSTDAATPDVILALHLPNIASIRVHGKLTEHGAYPLGIRFRNSFQLLLRTGINDDFPTHTQAAQTEGTCQRRNSSVLEPAPFARTQSE